MDAQIEGVAGDASVDAGTVRRLLAVAGTYNSDLGNDLPLREEVEFMVRGLAIAPDVALAWAALTQIASPAVVERPRWTWRQVWFMAGIVLVVAWLTLLSLLYTW